ncbi:hypothetical protein CsSME_00052422 [Camellia sinensis var. sinensis]
MPKDESAPHRFFDRSRRASPYARSPINTEQYRPKSRLQSVEGDEKEWEQVRCPICMEHPHNAVLLLCSSHEKGCRPYMCDTSQRHSNCFDQFCKSSPTTPSSTDLTQQVPLYTAAYREGIEEHRQNIIPRRRIHGRQFQPKLSCPLCRGQINGSIVIKPARHFLNSKPRSCSLETCDFSGTYSELRKHARLEHPFVRPSEADPRRQSDWMSLEHERDLQDIIGASGLVSAEEWNHWMSLDGAIDELTLASSQLEFAEAWNDWMSMDEGIDDLLNTLQQEVEDQQYNTLHMEIEIFLRYALNETSVSGSSEASDQSLYWRTTGMMRTGNPPSPSVNSLNETSVSGSSEASDQSLNWRTTGMMRTGNPPSPSVNSLNETSVSGSSEASDQSRNWRTTGMMRTGNPPSPSVNSLNETSVSGSSEASDQSRNWTTTARLRVGNPPIPRVDSLNATSVSGSSEASAQPHNQRTTARMRVGALPRGPLASRTGSRLARGSRMTLLLGPPSSGKTTLLLALSGKLDSDLKLNFSGKVTCNGHEMHEFVPQRTAAYISQHNLYIGEMTVRETLAFSARCQGVGSRYELSKREKAANIKPDPDIVMFMKVRKHCFQLRRTS